MRSSGFVVCSGFHNERLGDLALATKIPSRNIAEQPITDAPPQIKEGTTGLPAFKYLRKVTA